ncbi:hypothetical protein U14_00295 [Candidatus Moduliflexus flocculans]|uniref:Uncharacterized protein n=1 Tax=Candidatus Moduliflexus flocculans TaxID=1499966 RepID=A0A0S6VPS9_9BACT|nr:hypothetical protein U14_00295 [Candidatus Moduliflexus flocculans]
MTHDTLEKILDEYRAISEEEGFSDSADEEKCSPEALQRYLECLTTGKHKKRRRCISGELGSMRLD